MSLMTEWARAEGMRTIRGEVLTENVTMLQMCRELGFTIRSDQGNPGILKVERRFTGGEV
jgi:acetyltransferase